MRSHTWFSTRVRHLTRAIFVVLKVNLGFRRTFDSNGQTSSTSFSSVDIEMTYKQQVACNNQAASTT